MSLILYPQLKIRPPAIIRCRACKRRLAYFEVQRDNRLRVDLTGEIHDPGFCSGQVYPVEYAVRLEENEYDIVLGMKKPIALKTKILCGGVRQREWIFRINPMSPQNNPAVVEIDSAATRFGAILFQFCGLFKQYNAIRHAVLPDCVEKHL